MSSLLFVLFACLSEGEDGNSEDTSTEESLPNVVVSVRLLDIMGGTLPSGITLRNDIEEITLDDSHVGEIPVAANTQFYIQAEADGYVPHQFVAMSGQEDLSLVSFFAAEDMSLMMYNMLGIEADPEKSILIVALDHPNLSPAVGAMAEIDANHDGAFVMSGFGVEFSNIVTSSGGFVAFPNVEPGEVSIEITPPEGKSCWFHSVGGEGATVQVAPQQATVAFFVCD